MVEPSVIQLAHDVERLQAEVASLRAERKLLLKSLDLHERDRQLIGFEIHDGIIQDMTAALMFVESAGSQATFATPEMREKHDRGVRVLQAAVQEARRLIRGLIPIELDARGLSASIRAPGREIPRRPGNANRISQPNWASATSCPPLN